MKIERAAVVGAGVMGSAIAAHIANAGLPVLLLDIVPPGAKERDALAAGAIERMLKADPAPFMSKAAARLVTAGNLEDDLGKLADVDWIVEAVVENLEVKQALYAKLEGVRKKGSVVSSNTSTIPLKKLVEGLPDSFAEAFLITHFFNPPRYMRLLELVAGPRTRKATADAIRSFADERLGKGVVDCKDTPGFIANRIGTLWLQVAVDGAFAMGLSVEEADAVVGRPMGVPKTGVFGLMDLVGIDLMPHVAASMLASLPQGDMYRSVFREIPLVKKMIADGYTGRKGKGGFYRLARKEGGERIKESIDLASGSYAPSKKASLESVAAARKGGLKALLEHPDKGGQYAWRVLSRTLAYAASLVPEIADTIPAVDEAMRLGYAWRYGPFELIDRLGTAWFAEKLKAAGMTVPPLLERAAGRPFYKTEGGKLRYLATDGDYAELVRPAGVLLLADVKRGAAPLLRNASASLWDIGDGVVCLEFHSKMNAMDPDILDLIQRAMKLVKEKYKALVIHNEGDNFSVGANVGLVLFAANVGLWPLIEDMVGKGQATYKALKYAPFPVVAAPSGMALGGGCEIVLHASAVQAHAETYMGLVEVGVGLVPGWGGCKEVITRWLANRKRPRGPMPAIGKAFEMIGTAQVAKSAFEAREMLLLRESDGITMNRDRLLADAKARALELAKDFKPHEPPKEIRLPGRTARAALGLAVESLRREGKATPYDVNVSTALATVLSGGDTDITDTLSEDDLTKLERSAFMTLVRSEGTLRRIEHMLETGKPLRN
ncbi:MAG TPA: 3-hydroxyacyl-CoA dehydrogenase NAD-binding domain-containing protein [Alphaproteobacteria bacterium]|nr:3-hydroxyacyl-CoA dehydrogenase NAD-binding domain-containing protein [Alphaproteobacteria bacterium]